MDTALILETTFLIDLEREVARGLVGKAHRLVERNLDRRLCVTRTIAGELAAGPRITREAWQAILAPYPVLPITEEVAWQYGAIHRYLRRQGLLIGPNDLWIAATALVHGAAVVSRNRSEYDRVPGLTTVDYPDTPTPGG